MTDSSSLRPWVLFTFLGWLLGIVLVIAMALLSEALGIRAAQIPVGLGMGLGVGIAQERALRPLLGASHAWRWASALGLALPFFVADLARLLGVPLPYSLYATVAVAGVTTGACQAYVLSPHPISAPLWILTSTLGWTAGALMVAAADSLGNVPGLRGLLGAALYLALVAMGGVFLGLATHFPLRRLA
ncbi:MAG: hypothetical protein JJE39_07785 [Vicinamibacteria bacterium]|nr:hypothetical protein [Vicinamibacteria bacterium]